MLADGRSTSATQTLQKVNDDAIRFRSSDRIIGDESLAEIGEVPDGPQAPRPRPPAPRAPALIQGPARFPLPDEAAMIRNRWQWALTLGIALAVATPALAAPAAAGAVQAAAWPVPPGG